MEGKTVVSIIESDRVIFRIKSWRKTVKEKKMQLFHIKKDTEKIE